MPRCARASRIHAPHLYPDGRGYRLAAEARSMKTQTSTLWAFSLRSAVRLMPWLIPSRRD